VLGRTARICALEEELLTSSAPDDLRDDREAASREAWACPDSLTDTFHRLEGTAAAVGGELLLETRQLVTELDST
jgi:hypothetical protein